MPSENWNWLKSGAYIRTFRVYGWTDVTTVWVWTERLKLVDKVGWIALEGRRVGFENKVHWWNEGWIVLGCRFVQGWDELPWDRFAKIVRRYWWLVLVKWLVCVWVSFVY